MAADQHPPAARSRRRDTSATKFEHNLPRYAPSAPANVPFAFRNMSWSSPQAMNADLNPPTNSTPRTGARRSRQSLEFETMWRALPKERAVPHRRDFNPARAASLLRHIMLVEMRLDAMPSFPVRLVGGAAVEKIQRDLRGHDFLEFMPAELPFRRDRKRKTDAQSSLRSVAGHTASLRARHRTMLRSHRVPAVRRPVAVFACAFDSSGRIHPADCAWRQAHACRDGHGVRIPRCRRRRAGVAAERYVVGRTKTLGLSVRLRRRCVHGRMQSRAG